MVRQLIAALSLFSIVACHRIFDGELHGSIACTDEGAYDAPHCPPKQTCVAGVCATVGAPLGYGCTEDGDCRAPAFCLDPAIVGAEGEMRCSLPCCAATDCGPAKGGQVCWVPPGGAGSFCWSAAELGRGALGEATGGQPCVTGEECRSGLCDVECVDLCCDSSYCQDQICRTLGRAELGDHALWACGRPPASSTVEVCDSDDDCETGLCLTFVGGLQFCAEPCCSSLDCGSKVVMAEEYLVACVPTPDGLRACSQFLASLTPLPMGTPCERGTQCRSGLCLFGYCSDVCCTDASCGDQNHFSCRPVEDAGTWALRCVRK